MSKSKINYKQLKSGGYSFVLDDGKTPEESDSADALNGCCYANIGGFV